MISHQFWILTALLFTYADGSRGDGVFMSFFPHDIYEIEAARITKHDIEMFHDESRKHIAGLGLCIPVSAVSF